MAEAYHRDGLPSRGLFDFLWANEPELSEA